MRLTFTIIGVNVAVFVLQLIFPLFTELFALTPVQGMDGSYWQFITYAFLHGGPWHLFLNMIILGIFGPAVEHHLGWKKYLVLYFLAALGSAFLHIAVTGDALIKLLGASGSVFGVLTAYAYLFPRNIILVFFVPMPAILAVALITAFELIVGILGIFPGIANFGHIGGIVTAVLLMMLWRYRTPRLNPEDREPTSSYEFIWE